MPPAAADRRHKQRSLLGLERLVHRIRGRVASYNTQLDEAERGGQRCEEQHYRRISSHQSQIGGIPHRKSKTFRLQGIPSSYNEADIQQLVKEALRLGSNATVGVCSVAHSTAHPSEIIATLEILPTPSFIQCTDKDEWVLARPGERDGPVLDTHFRGMTPLHSSEDADTNIDLVAISGLGGHAFGSFKKKGDDSYMWLRDSLPQHLPCLRVFIYGYDSHLQKSDSFQTIHDLAIAFRTALRDMRNFALDAGCERPLILLGHSLGGIILKQALVQMMDCDRLDQANLKATCGIMLFGVPNHGMDVESLVSLVHDQPNCYLIETLRSSSEVLESQKQAFPRAFNFKDSKVFSFYETLKSPTARQDQVDGKWRMCGEPVILVDRHSATHCRDWESGGEYVYPINLNHSEMVKFSNAQDQYYNTVRNRLKLLVENGGDIVKRRFQVYIHDTFHPENIGSLNAAEQQGIRFPTAIGISNHSLQAPPVATHTTASMPQSEPQKLQANFLAYSTFMQSQFQNLHASLLAASTISQQQSQVLNDGIAQFKARIGVPTAENDGLHEKLSGLERMLGKKHIGPPSPTVKAVIDTLQGILDKSKEKLSHQQFISQQTERHEASNRIDATFKAGSEEIERLQGLLRASLEVTLNERRPRNSANKSGQFLSQKINIESSEIPEGLVTIMTVYKLMRLVTNDIHAERRGIRPEEAVLLFSRFRFLPKDSNLNTKLTATIQQIVTSWGYNSRAPMIWIHQIIPYDSEILNAIRDSDLGTVKKLFRDGKAMIRDCSPQGESLLSVAIAWERSHICQFLIDNGADEETMEFSGRSGIHYTPLGMVMKFANFSNGRRKTQKDILEMLVRAGADISNAMVGGGHENCVELFRMTDSSFWIKVDSHPDSLGLPICERFESGRTLLLEICLIASDEPDSALRGIETLIKLGADVNAEDDDGNTCLHILQGSCTHDWKTRQDWKSHFWNQKGHKRNPMLMCVLLCGLSSMLISAGADPSRRNNDGSTPSEVFSQNTPVDDKEVLLIHESLWSRAREEVDHPLDPQTMTSHEFRLHDEEEFFRRGGEIAKATFEVLYRPYWDAYRRILGTEFFEVYRRGAPETDAKYWREVENYCVKIEKKRDQSRGILKSRLNAANGEGQLLLMLGEVCN